MGMNAHNGYLIQTDDTRIYGASTEYTVDYYIDKGIIGNGKLFYREYESAYREFVYGNYLAIDSETLEFMKDIIESEGFRLDDADIIKKVANYIMKSATYSYDYDKNLNNSENIAISFLRDYKEGVCKHYAMAATMLYRAIGVPARYTVGAVADAVAGEWTDVSALSAHAWVEVYVDGIGWQMVEVTGGSSVGGESVGEGGVDFGDTPNSDMSKEELEQIKLYSVLAGKTGPIYLKSVSYGDYIGKGFKAAEVYTPLLNSQYSASYLTSIALKNTASKYHIFIKNISDGAAPYVLPYYADINKSNGYNIQKDDTKNIGTANTYDLYFYDYVITPPKHSIYSYRVFEENYRSFVNGNYLQIDSETYDYMQNIISSEGFNIYDANIIAKVATYIQNSATYNMEYDEKLDKSANIAVAFLDNYKEGVCRHYAMAATMLYRALGIPARYTEGAMVNAINGEWVDIDASMLHAWVEVYVDGIGWQMVEVTGGGFGGETVVPDKEIAPENLYMHYLDGNILDASGISKLAGFEEYEALGYEYRNLVVEGQQIGIGKSQSTIKSVEIYLNGKNVTAEFAFKPGTIQIYRDILRPFDVSEKYNGVDTFAPIQNDLDGFEEYRNQGYWFSNLYIDGSRMEPGISQSTVRDGLVIYDTGDNDVTDEFKIEPGIIHVYRAVLKPFDEEKLYAGGDGLFPVKMTLKGLRSIVNRAIGFRISVCTVIFLILEKPKAR
jgi:transglutaminase-like putative cysteine protease